MLKPRAALLVSAALLAGCVARPVSAPDPQSSFMARLNALCGKAFAGKIVGSEPSGADDDMAGKSLIMHVRGCEANRVEIPFHVGENHSRTWIITRTATGLRLKHDHRHDDGTADKVTLYGGDTAGAGTAGRQSFPVDAASIANFRTNGLERSITNVWAIEVSDVRNAAPKFVYELRRPPGPTSRLFRVEFELSRTVEVPPKPWGW